MRVREKGKFGFSLVLALLLPGSVLAQSCEDIAGIWSVEESATVTTTLEGEVEVDTVSGSGEVEITQDGCSVSYSQTVQDVNGSVEVVRSGSVAGDVVAFTGYASPSFVGAGCAVNEVTATGTISGNTISLSTQSLLDCSIADYVVEGVGSATFTRGSDVPQSEYSSVATQVSPFLEIEIPVLSLGDDFFSVQLDFIGGNGWELGEFSPIDETYPVAATVQGEFVNLHCTVYEGLEYFLKFRIGSNSSGGMEFYLESAYLNTGCSSIGNEIDAELNAGKSFVRGNINNDFFDMKNDPGIAYGYAQNVREYGDLLTYVDTGLHVMVAYEWGSDAPRSIESATLVDYLPPSYQPVIGDFDSSADGFMAVIHKASGEQYIPSLDSCDNPNLASWGAYTDLGGAGLSYPSDALSYLTSGSFLHPYGQHTWDQYTKLSLDVLSAVDIPSGTSFTANGALPPLTAYGLEQALSWLDEVQRSAPDCVTLPDGALSTEAPSPVQASDCSAYDDAEYYEHEQGSIWRGCRVLVGDDYKFVGLFTRSRDGEVYEATTYADEPPPLGFPPTIYAGNILAIEHYENGVKNGYQYYYSSTSNTVTTILEFENGQFKQIVE
ncbi:MAG: hypothetical protein R3332_10375 [Pseudohongiellaceae bacterium]|nr:hypothetical protein [Pseudohongiellaceae bacterium]